ncbi:MAG: ribonuclease D [Syntrophobacteraceae bacterium]
MKPAIVIETPAELNDLVERLLTEQYIAVDTESNSFYAYFERVCLIQISTPEDDFIIDPLVIQNIDRLGEVLLNPSIEKIFHAASNDVLGLKRDFSFHIQNLFDTAIACKLLGHKQLGLARVLEEHFGILLNKKWQRHDWGRRPLKQEQLDYARFDTHFLIALRHRLATDIQALDIWEVAAQAFSKACEQESQQRTFQPESFMQINGAQALDPPGKRILKALYLYRDHEARRRNRAPFRILSNETLLRLAHNPPKDMNEFYKIKGIPRPYHNSRAAHHLLKLIRNTEEFGDELTANR